MKSFDYKCGHNLDFEEDKPINKQKRT